MGALSQTDFERYEAQMQAEDAEAEEAEAAAAAAAAGQGAAADQGQGEGSTLSVDRGEQEMTTPPSAAEFDGRTSSQVYLSMMFS